MVSIIMPAYNAEKYIEEAIESILTQSYTDWELIIVDDGSADGTSDICDHFAQKDPRIRVIHQDNKGVSAARNAGLMRAKGEYIAFADADDILPPNSLKVRVDLIGGADLVIAGYELFDENGIIERMPARRRKCWDTHDAVRNIIAAGEIGYQGFLWNKLFKKKIILGSHIEFDKNITVNEDRLFCVEYALFSKNSRISDDLVYRYRVTQTGTMSSIDRLKDKKIYMSEFVAADKAMNMVKKRYSDCYYIGAVEAQYRAVILKRRSSGSTAVFREELDRMIMHYGKISLKAPRQIVGHKQKLAVFAHMILKK